MGVELKRLSTKLPHEVKRLNLNKINKLIGHIYGYNHKLTIFKKPQVKYFSANVWRLMYLIQGREVYHFNNKRVWARSSHVPVTFRRYKLHIHAGKKWNYRFVSRWVVGFRSGEFCWNRKLAIYKAKQMKKKNKKLLKEKAKLLRAQAKVNKTTKSKTKK